MPTPDAEEFARTVLWHLAGLRAEVASLNVQLHDLQEAAGRPVTTEFVQKCVERDRKSQMDTYLDACKQARLDPGLESESDDE
jgi:hypothetical protein